MQLHPIYCTLRSIEWNSALKRQCHEIFCFWFFSWINFPPAPEYSIKTISNFFENSRRYSQFKVHHRYQGHRRQIFPPVSLALLIPVATGGNRWQPVSTIGAANFPPVANCHRFQRHWRQICHRCKQWDQLSNCWQLKMNLKRKKVIFMLTLLPKDVQKKSEKFYWLKMFSICHRCSGHQWQTLSCEYPRIFEKIRNGPNGIIRGLGETDSWKKP